MTQAVMGVPALVNDFWQNNRGAAPVAAFTAAPDSYATTPGGDNYLRKNNNSSGQPYATDIYDLSTSSSTRYQFTQSGYSVFTNQTFQGYIQGPRYWGKTFFIWPPDPTNDWRQKYFLKTDGVTPVNDNTLLWDSSGNWRDPEGYYVINYKAILAWISANPNIFPTQLRSGNILFYDHIPSDVPAAAYDHTQPNRNITDPTQRFWKEYIDWVIGVWRDPMGNIQHPQTPSCSIGPDYTFGTVQITSRPTGGNPYMNYTDNPKRPRHRLWFGPMTMIQFMSDTGLFPGTTHDIQMYPMKNGVGAALTDIQNNHPNTNVALILFNRPQYANDPPQVGTFNLAQYSLGTNYAGMINSLWLPPNSGSADVRPWDANGQLTPRAFADYTSNTASSYGFMLAYNQFSSSPVLSSLDTTTAPGTGGLGRVGAQRLIIYETDGMANQDSIPVGGFVNVGANNSYYAIQTGQTLNGASYNETKLLQVVQAICNNPDGTPGTPNSFSSNPGYPGFSKPGKPVMIQCIAFGAIFETPSSTQTSAVNLLGEISSIGGTTFPASASDPANGYKWCIGTLSQREQKLKQAFLNAMDSSIPVVLVK